MVMKMRKHYRTPSRIMADMIEAALKVSGTNRAELAKLARCSPNTLTADLKDPERIPQGRLWLYLTALSIPVEDVLRGIAYSVADKAIER